MGVLAACASGDARTGIDAATEGDVDASVIAPDGAPAPDAGPMVGRCEECVSNADCPETDQCQMTGSGKICLPRCTTDNPDCPEGFQCGGVESTFCAPIDGLCCVDGDDDSYGQGVGCVDADCDDDDDAVNPGMPDICNGVDDDCNAGSEDGVDDPMLGDDCDGDDSDLCEEGALVCDTGALTCDDTTGDTLDVCNGIDDDCNPSTLDGADEATVGTACDSAGDPDSCLDDVYVCDSSAGMVVCNDEPGGGVELCDGLDNDCDPATEDGSGDPDVGVACDGSDADLCTEGTTYCSGGAVLCDDTTGDTPDVCDGTDNDCNPGTIDGSGDPDVGTTCDGPDTDLCAEGLYTCNTGVLVCSDSTGDTLDVCNGADDDCNPATADGSGDAAVGVPCDGSDGDLCNEGTTFCNGSGTVQCDDTTGTLSDVCDGVDNDCNPATADGSGDPSIGMPCDGSDSDLCNEGVFSCSGGALSCGDTSSSTIDICNGIDDDCDPSSADGSEDPLNGAACDGADSDLCNEGTYSCSGGALSCSDTTSSTTDICNGIDDDCDPSSADGAEDPLLGDPCDGSDTDLCIEGTYSCSGGALSCSDTTSSTTELCNATDDDCDGATDEDFIRNDNPLCSGGVFNLGSVSGDTGADVLTDSWWNEEWDRVTIREDSSSSIYVSATIQLYSPPGTDYDLYVYCNGCGGGLAGSSLNGGTSGHYDTVQVRSNDDLIVDDGFDVIIEVRHWSSTVCAFWDLTVTGNTAVSTETCN